MHWKGKFCIEFFTGLKAYCYTVILFQTTGSENCGDSTFTAARSDAPKRKNLDETGIQVCCCRHGVIKKAVNMFRGETYRHSNYLEVFLRRQGYEFICGDVMCKYKFFSQKVSRLQDVNGRLLFPELSNSKYFLARMHAVAHVWYCQASKKNLF